MTNSLTNNEIGQVAEALNGYEQWKLARSVSMNWLSVSAYVDALALEWQAARYQEIFALLQQVNPEDENTGEIMDELLTIVGLHD